MVESARLEIVYVLRGASRVRIPLSPYFALRGYVWQARYACRRVRHSYLERRRRLPTSPKVATWDKTYGWPTKLGCMFSFKRWSGKLMDGLICQVRKEAAGVVRLCTAPNFFLTEFIKTYE